MELVRLRIEVCRRLTSVPSNVSHGSITVSLRVLAELRIFDKDSFQFYFRRMGSISDREGATSTSESTRKVLVGHLTNGFQLTMSFGLSLSAIVDISIASFTIFYLHHLQAGFKSYVWALLVW